MTDLVNPSEIEKIVGASRHATRHIARAVDGQETVYVLHSAECRDSGIDLRECEFSLALDRGIGQARWAEPLRNTAVYVEIVEGLLIPTAPVPPADTYALARAEAIQEGAVSPRDRAAHGLMRGVVDSLPHWTNDLHAQDRDYWRGEADRAIGNLLEVNELAEILFRGDYQNAPDVEDEWRMVLADDGEDSSWHRQARYLIGRLSGRAS